MTIQLKMPADEILTESRKYLGKPGSWTTGSLGYVGRSVCAIGALSLITNNYVGTTIATPMEDDNGMNEAMKALFDSIPPTRCEQIMEDHSISKAFMKDSFASHTATVWRYNDSLKHVRSVTKWFDRAIKLVQKPPVDEATKIIDDAIKVLSMNWVRGEIGSPDKPACAIGGLVKALETWPVVNDNGNSDDIEFYYPTGSVGFPAANVKIDEPLGQAIQRVYDAVPDYVKSPTDSRTDIDDMVNTIVRFNDSYHRVGDQPFPTSNGWYKTEELAKANVLAWFERAKAL